MMRLQVGVSAGSRPSHGVLRLALNGLLIKAGRPLQWADHVVEVRGHLQGLLVATVPAPC